MLLRWWRCKDVSCCWNNPSQTFGYSTFCGWLTFTLDEWFGSMYAYFTINMQAHKATSSNCSTDLWMPTAQVLVVWACNQVTTTDKLVSNRFWKLFHWTKFFCSYDFMHFLLVPAAQHNEVLARLFTAQKIWIQDCYDKHIGSAKPWDLCVNYL